MLIKVTKLQNREQLTKTKVSCESSNHCSVFHLFLNTPSSANFKYNSVCILKIVFLSIIEFDHVHTSAATITCAATHPQPSCSPIGPGNTG